MNLYLHLGRGKVGNVLRLDLSFLNGLRDTLTQGVHRLGIRQFTNHQRLVVELLDLGTHLQQTASLTVVVLAHINATASGEVGIQCKWLPFQVGNGRLTDLIIVMRQDLRAQTHGNALGTLSQQQGVFGRKGNRFLVPSIVAQLPLGSLGIENHVEGEFRESCLNISGRCSTVTCQDVSPVSLAVNQQVFLS